MRLGLEPSSPRMPPRTHALTLSSPSARASAAFPIDVDASGDEAEPQGQAPHNAQVTITPAVYTPLLLSPSRHRTAEPKPTAYESSDESDAAEEKESEPQQTQPQSPAQKPSLNFFFNVNERGNTPRKQRAESIGSSISASSSTGSSRQEDSQKVTAARTCVCGEKFDRCDLDFRADRVKLTIWKKTKRQWKGFVEYAHLVRFCFADVDKPPYILLMQLDGSRGRSDFASFYDSIFAKVCSENSTKEHATPQIFGVVLYFDEPMDYIRCQSMADINKRLAVLFAKPLTDREVREYSKWDSFHRLRDRHPRREEPLKSTTSRSRGLAAFVGDGAKQALGTVTQFFRTRTSVLEDADNAAVVTDQIGSGRSRTLNLTRTRETSANSDEEKSAIPVDGDTKELGEGDVDKTVIVIQNTQHEEHDGKEESVAEALTSSALEEEGKREVDTKKRAVSQRREEERVKRRRMETRRNEVLLSYPYDDSETSGRISVTLGDVDRLTPGEFLNDNIIDFYLRFLWRHLEPWQQQEVYFFSSHFFTQLNGTNGVHELAAANPDERFARVARWTQKEMNLFDKRFLFIPINDSFHWSIAVFCNPGSAIIKKRRMIKRHPHNGVVDANKNDIQNGEVVNLVDCSTEDVVKSEKVRGSGSDDGIREDVEVEEEELTACQEERLANPPCLLFLDSLRCHRKKKFTKMLRNYLECEWKARFSSSAMPKQEVKENKDASETEEDSIVTSFDLDSIGLLEPNIPLQSNSSDCGVFLLMYAASIVDRFPMGVTRDDLESHLTSTLSPNMFGDEHVLEFREYLHQLLFCLQFLQSHGLPETHVRDEGLDRFAID